LQKLAEQDPKIQAIIEKIQELSDGFWYMWNRN
jgi:hypothetical protein